MTREVLSSIGFCLFVAGWVYTAHTMFNGPKESEEINEDDIDVQF